MKLEFKEPAPKKHLAVCLVGPEGAGKTVAAASAPAPIIYVNADRPGALRFSYQRYKSKTILEYGMTARRDLEQLYMALRSGGYDDVQTVVLDSMGKVYDVVLADIAKDSKKPTLPERGEANTFIDKFVESLIALDVHVVLVAHDNPVVTSGNEEEGTAVIELFPFCGTNSPSLAKRIMRQLDIVAYCGRKVTKDGDVKRTEFVAQLAPGAGRRVKETTGVLDEVEPLDLTDWIERIDIAYSTTDVKEKVAA